MLRIAVIDDDKTLLCDMHKLFDRFIIAYDFDFTVEYFSSCEDIYAKFKAGEKYDLLFPVSYTHLTLPTNSRV